MGKVSYPRSGRAIGRDENHPSSGRLRRSRRFRLVSLGAVVAVSLVGCGGRTSQEDLNALLGDRQAPSAQDVPKSGEVPLDGAAAP